MRQQCAQATIARHGLQGENRHYLLRQFITILIGFKHAAGSDNWWCCATADDVRGVQGRVLSAKPREDHPVTDEMLLQGKCRDGEQ
jgi:hypothetical protein